MFSGMKLRPPFSPQVLISCAVMFVNMGCIAYECGPAGAGPTRTWRRQLERQHSLRRRRMQQHRAKEE